MLLLVMCHFTKFVQLIPMRSKTAKATAAALFYNVFLVHGFPTKLTTDRGTEFISAMQMEMYKLLDIHKLTTSPYRPQCDGRNENSHRSIFNIVKILCENQPENWLEAAFVGAFAWNSSSSSVLQHLTPFELMYGRQPNLPHDLAMAKVARLDEKYRTETNYASFAEYLNDSFTVMQHRFHEAKLSIALDANAKFNSQKKLKDANTSAHLRPGKLVIVYRPTATCDGDRWSKKLLFQFAGPYRVKKVYRNSVHLEDLNGNKATTQNVNNVYPYNPAADQVMDAFDRKLLTNDECDAALGDLVGKMIICDLSGRDGQDSASARS